MVGAGRTASSTSVRSPSVTTMRAPARPGSMDAVDSVPVSVAVTVPSTARTVTLVPTGGAVGAVPQSTRALEAAGPLPAAPGAEPLDGAGRRGRDPSPGGGAELGAGRCAAPTSTIAVEPPATVTMITVAAATRCHLPPCNHRAMRDLRRPPPAGRWSSVLAMVRAFLSPRLGFRASRSVALTDLVTPRSAPGGV
jgi:hypothetical protein